VAALAGNVGCSSKCPPGTIVDRAAGPALELSCAQTDLTTVTLSGPCANASAAAPNGYIINQGAITILSQTPGLCHVVLKFTTGFTYATDINFTTMTDLCGETFVGASQAQYPVDNPSSTCLDGGTTDSANGVLSCAMTAQQGCSTSSTDECNSTWAMLQADASLCASSPIGRYFEYDCGGYHVLRAVAIDSSGDYYYDGTSGTLVAILYNDEGTLSCAAGPAAGFTPPSGCTNTTSPPPNCTVDGGPHD
jgi:hypothetical protein